MDRLLPGALVILALVGVLFLMYLGWQHRRRRQSGLEVAQVPEPERGDALLEVTGFYVATTTAGDPLDRLTIPGLAFRGRVTVTVHGAGVAIAVQGERDVFVRKQRIRSVGTSTWTIDRVVEQGGMVRLDWTLDKAADPKATDPKAAESGATTADVESYLRISTPADSIRLIDAVTELTERPGTTARNQEGSLT
jgi:hypothetical protein